MAIEPKRGCGFRKVGGLYLVGDGLTVLCDRLPLVLPECQTCGEHVRFSRGIQGITPLGLWGSHDIPTHLDEQVGTCTDSKECFVCRPGARAWLMWVGADYTPASFVAEAKQLGISKRIAAVPIGLKLGESWVYLAYLKLISAVCEGCKVKPEKSCAACRGAGTYTLPGVFYAFRPKRIEAIITDRQEREGKAMGLIARGINSVIVPEDDPDHNPRAKAKKADVDNDASSAASGHPAPLAEQAMLLL